MKYRKMSFYLTAYGKYLMLASIVLLLVLGTSVTVYASETDEIVTSDASSDTVYTVTEIKNSDELSNLAPFEIARRASSQDTEALLQYLRDNNLLTVTATITDNNGEILGEEDLRVAWDCTNNSTSGANVAVCGEYTETGTILLPDNYQWGEDVINTLKLTVIVYEPELIEIVELISYESDFNMAFSLAQGADIDAFLDGVSLQQTCDFKDAAGNIYLCPIVYHTEAIRTDELGIYYITATFEAPDNCYFSEELNIPTYSIPISVQAPGQPRLDVSYIGTFTRFIYFPWTTSDIDLNTMEVWVSENEGEWRQMEPDDEVYVHSIELQIDPWMLTEDNSYRIQVKYEGGQTGIASFTYGWDVLSDKEYIEGDRDGGDTDGNPPQDSNDDESTNAAPPQGSNDDESVNAAPPQGSNDDESVNAAPPQDSNDNESTNAAPPQGSNDDESTNAAPPQDSNDDESVNAAPPQDSNDDESTIAAPPQGSDNGESTIAAPPQGSDNDESTIAAPPQDFTNITDSSENVPYLQGSEIRLMLENLGAARFSAETIMLDIPADAIASLDISDTDRLLVTILPLENNGFSIDILKNDVAVTTIPSMQISLPYQPVENTTPVLINEAGREVATGDYKPDTGLVSFTISETGTFYLKDIKAPAQEAYTVKTLTATEISTVKENNDNSVPKLIAITAAITIPCSAAATTLIYTKKRRR
ncbi:MAG: hypothetical protein IJO65_08220 [Lachnospiraceae bacterium]|nr:hypothetical protein [Lachnospiraceae bacterium]